MLINFRIYQLGTYLFDESVFLWSNLTVWNALGTCCSCKKEKEKIQNSVSKMSLSEHGKAGEHLSWFEFFEIAGLPLPYTDYQGHVQD